MSTDPAHKPNLRILGDDEETADAIAGKGPDVPPALAAADAEEAAKKAYAGWPHYDMRAEYQRDIAPLLQQLQNKLNEHKIPGLVIVLPYVNRDDGMVSSAGMCTTFEDEATNRPIPATLYYIGGEYLAAKVDLDVSNPPAGTPPVPTEAALTPDPKE